MCNKIFTLVCISFFATQSVYADEGKAPAVIVATQLQPGQIGESYQFVGTFSPYNAVTLKAKIAGTIAEILFNDGDEVAAGALLIRLKDAEQKAQVKKTEARLNLSKTKLKRVNTLIQKGFSTQAEYDQAKAQVQLDEADYLLAKEELEKTKITAPFEGVLSSRKVSQGAYVKQGDELVDLKDIDPIRLKFEISENQIGKLTKGLAFQISTDAFPEETFLAEIEVVEPTIHESSRTLTAFAKVENKEQKLKPGLFGKALVNVNMQAAQLLPEAALVYQKGGIFVYKIDSKNTIKLSPITIGRRQNDQVEIISGLNLGESVILEGQEKVKDGDTVEIKAK